MSKQQYTVGTVNSMHHWNSRQYINYKALTSDSSHDSQRAQYRQPTVHSKLHFTQHHQRLAQRPGKAAARQSPPLTYLRGERVRLGQVDIQQLGASLSIL